MSKAHPSEVPQSSRVTQIMLDLLMATGRLDTIKQGITALWEEVHQLPTRVNEPGSTSLAGGWATTLQRYEGELYLQITRLDLDSALLEQLRQALKWHPQSSTLDVAHPDQPNDAIWIRLT